MQVDAVNKLTYDILHYAMPDIAAIITGIDDLGARLFCGQDGKLTCEDAIGFAAIGAGYWHAQSQFMFAGYSRRASAAKSLYLVYAAKKRAEMAPGVGSETDMFLMGPQPGTYDTVKRSVIDEVASIYNNNLKKSKKVYERTEKEVSEYIETLAPAQTQPEQQEALPPPEPPPGQKNS
jgi:hypothetical protein